MRKFYILLNLLIASLAAQSQSMRDTVVSINEVVINENRFNTAISKQNRNVYIIDRETIEKLPARSIQEILQYCNGIDLRQRGPFGAQADLSIDGGSFEQSVVLLNGTKIIDSQTAHNMLNLPIPVEAIERIEVIRGPAARIYGINSLTGAINIVTKRPKDSGLVLSAYAGSNFEKDTAGTGKTFHGRGIQGGLSLSKEHHQHSLFASHDKSNGYRYNTQFDNNKVLYLGNYQLNSSNEIISTFGYVKNSFGANGFYASPGDKNSTEIVQTTLASIQSKHYLSGGWTLMPRFSYRYNDDDYRYYGDENLNSGRSRHFNNSLAAEFNSSYKTATGELGLGAEARREDINSSNIGEHRRDNFGLYAQYRTSIVKNLNVNIGTYLNYNSDYKWQLYPGIDASYELSPILKITGNIGTSQRLPSFTDLFLDQRPGNIGNAEVEPEKAFQGELGLRIGKSNLGVNLNAFHRKISNFIDWTRQISTEPWQANNVGQLITQGINMQSNYSVLLDANIKVNLTLGYSYLDSEFDRTKIDIQSKYLVSSLKHQLTQTSSIQIKGFNMLFATRFNQRGSGASYWINDCRVSQAMGKISLFADAQNIFNTTYFEVGSVPLPARWFSLGLKFASPRW